MISFKKFYILGLNIFIIYVMFGSIALAQDFNRDYDIYIFDTKNGSTVQLTQSPDQSEFNPGFSNDGKTIVHDVLTTTSHDLYLTDVASGLCTPLTGGEGGNDGVFSPNGKYIAFDRVPLGDPSIYVVPSKGGIPQLVRTNAVEPDWSNNSHRLVFVDVTDGSIRTIDLRTGEETTVSSFGYNPTWSPNGNYIAFAIGQFIGGIVVNEKGEALSDPFAIDIGPDLSSSSQPTWDNHSRAIAFASDRDGDYDIWQVAIGGVVTRLTGLQAFGDFDPAFSNNGRYIAYAGYTAPAVAPSITSQSESEEISRSSTFSLEQNYPNPFNPTTDIRFSLPEASTVSIRIYNSTGQLIKTLVSGNLDAGYHSFQWDATNYNGQEVAAGVYLYRITAGNYINTKKMILMK